MNPFSFIKQKVSILTVVSEYTNLKKAGFYFKACCPFHHEKTASFSVSPNKEIFYCFGCQAGGDVISFIQKIENCSPLEAIKFLSERYNISLPEKLNFSNGDNQYKEKKQYVAICTTFAKWCHEQLKLNKIAMEYLENRLITKENINDFSLGYFPLGAKGIENLLNYSSKEGFIAQDFLDAKILKNGQNGLYCPFENRIIFPIKDHLGAICGFGGRIYLCEDERVKYYNSHDHLFFNKGHLLFGLDKAKKSIQQSGTAFLVEGYTDLIAMFQYGYKNTVATLGTACTQEHLNIISRYSSKLYVLYDGDNAGQKAIIRLISLCWKVNLDLFVIMLPKDEDPASYLNINKNLDLIIDLAKDIFSFYIYYLGKDFKSKSMQERLQGIKQLISIIKNLDDEVKQDILLDRASEVFDLPFDTLKSQLNKSQADQKKKTLSSNNFNRKSAIISRKHFVDFPKVSRRDEVNSTVSIGQKDDLIQMGEYLPDIKANELDEKYPMSGDNDTSDLKKVVPKDIAQLEISKIEKKLFSDIIVYDINLSKEDQELLLLWLSKPLASIIKKVLNFKTDNPSDIKDIFNIFDIDEKELVSKIIMEVEDVHNFPFDQLLLQFYKKHWKTLIYNVRLSIDNAQKNGDESRVGYLLANLDNFKKKMLRRGIT